MRKVVRVIEADLAIRRVISSSIVRCPIVTLRFLVASNPTIFFKFCFDSSNFPFNFDTQ
jgi:hypothetical protein